MRVSVQICMATLVVFAIASVNITAVQWDYDDDLIGIPPAVAAMQPTTDPFAVPPPLNAEQDEQQADPWSQAEHEFQPRFRSRRGHKVTTETTHTFDPPKVTTKTTAEHPGEPSEEKGDATPEDAKEETPAPPAAEEENKEEESKESAEAEANDKAAEAATGADAGSGADADAGKGAEAGADADAEAGAKGKEESEPTPVGPQKHTITTTTTTVTKHVVGDDKGDDKDDEESEEEKKKDEEKEEKKEEKKAEKEDKKEKKDEKKEEKDEKKKEGKEKEEEKEAEKEEEKKKEEEKEEEDKEGKKEEDKEKEEEKEGEKEGEDKEKNDKEKDGKKGGKKCKPHKKIIEVAGKKLEVTVNTGEDCEDGEDDDEEEGDSEDPLIKNAEKEFRHLEGEFAVRHKKFVGEAHWVEKAQRLISDLSGKVSNVKRHLMDLHRELVILNAKKSHAGNRLERLQNAAKAHRQATELQKHLGNLIQSSHSLNQQMEEMRLKREEQQKRIAEAMNAIKQLKGCGNECNEEPEPSCGGDDCGNESSSSGSDETNSMEIVAQQ
jgi:hypothetical protein